MGQHLFRHKRRAASNYQGDDNYDEKTFHALMELVRLELPAYMEDVLQADKEDLYLNLHMDIEACQWFEESFPETTFALVLDFINDPRFLKAKNGWPFFSIFHSEWDKITQEQKSLLLRTLKGIYEKFEDSMPRFSISELVGEDFEPSRAFTFFSDFAASPFEGARVFVPHGYEHALRNSTDENLKAQLWNALLSMEHDESENVRGEVEETLFRLANRGIQRP